MLIESQFAFQKILPLSEYAELEGLLKQLLSQKLADGELSIFTQASTQLPVWAMNTVCSYVCRRKR
jgi:hypothetical protein